MKNSKPDRKANRSMLFTVYLMVGLFVCMIGYFCYFLQFQSETVINNSYNARLDRFSDRDCPGRDPKQ